MCLLPRHRNWKLLRSIGVSVDGRNETAAERADRNLAELLQELRIAALGIQVLFGFLLAMPFAARFTELTSYQRHLYTASLLLSVIATALLLGPVAYHRLVLRRHEKSRLVAAANVMALSGLIAVGLAITSAVGLVLSVVDSRWPVPVFTCGTILVLFLLWFVVPMSVRRNDFHHTREPK